MTKKDLQEYYWTQKSIAKLEQRIDELHALATRQTSRIKNDADSIHGGGFFDRQGEALAQLADLRSELLEQLQRSYEQQVRIEQAIKDLPEREKYLIRARYVERKSWEAICVDMNYSWPRIHEIHSGALKILA